MGRIGEGATLPLAYRAGQAKAFCYPGMRGKVALPATAGGR